MNDTQLNQVLDKVDEALTFMPGQSTQLVAQNVSTKKIINDAIALNENLLGVIEERIAFWLDEKQKMQEFANWLAGAAAKTAAELDKKITKDYKLAKTISDARDEHMREEDDDRQANGTDAEGHAEVQREADT